MNRRRPRRRVLFSDRCFLFQRAAVVFTGRNVCAYSSFMYGSTFIYPAGRQQTTVYRLSYSCCVRKGVYPRKEQGDKQKSATVGLFALFSVVGGYAFMYIWAA